MRIRETDKCSKPEVPPLVPGAIYYSPPAEGYRMLVVDERGYQFVDMETGEFALADFMDAEEIRQHMKACGYELIEEAELLVPKRNKER